MAKPVKVFLHLDSWIGLSLGAQHYYGTLECWHNQKSRKHQLTHVLTAREAAESNKWRSDHGYDKTAWAGKVSKGFETLDEIYTLALAIWKEHFPDGEILLEGRSGIGDPQKILVWPGHTQKEIDAANAIWEQFEEIEGYQYKRNWPKAESLQDKWDKLVEGQ